MYFRLFYILIGYILSILVSCVKLNTLFLICLHPLLKIDGYHKFLCIELNEFFITAIHLTFIISLVFIFPLLCWHIFCFFKVGWYYNQYYDFSLILGLFLTIFLIFLIINYFYVLPLVYNFLLYGINPFNEDILKIISESRLFHYIKFICKLLFFVSNLCLYLCWTFLFLITRHNKKYLLYFLLKYRKLIFLYFIIVNCLFFFDFLLFLLSLYFLIFYYYFIIFILCLFLSSLGEIWQTL